MRLFLEVLALVAIIGLGASIFADRSQADLMEQSVRDARAATRRIEQEIKLQIVLKETPLNKYGYPETVDPAWFESGVPQNPLIQQGHPWLEIASPTEWMLQHPRQPVAIDRGWATFWYNPRLGILRARVPQMISDRRTLEVYNRVNASRLAQLYQDSQAELSEVPTP